MSIFHDLSNDRCPLSEKEYHVFRLLTGPNQWTPVTAVFLQLLTARPPTFRHQRIKAALIFPCHLNRCTIFGCSMFLLSWIDLGLSPWWPLLDSRCFSLSLSTIKRPLWEQRGNSIFECWLTQGSFFTLVTPRFPTANGLGRRLYDEWSKTVWWTVEDDERPCMMNGRRLYDEWSKTVWWMVEDDELVWWMVEDDENGRRWWAVKDDGRRKGQTVQDDEWSKKMAKDDCQSSDEQSKMMV